MPAFSGAQNFMIQNSQFTDNSTTISTTNISSRPSGIDILLDASYPEAAHDAAGREYSPRCFPGTRKQHIEDIVNWVIPPHGENPTSIYWMKGPAGVGKSAVAQTCAEELKSQEKLGAAFFFSISGRNKPEKFFPSIAYQLSTTYPLYHDLIDKKIRRDKTLVKKSLAFQFRYLIDEPLRELGAQGIGKRVAVIVDGLDECEGVDAQCDIIHIIASGASVGTLPLCWVFFSRPEPHIEGTFAGTTFAPHCHKVVLPISRDADEDIELYLRNSFENILKCRNTSMELQWPSDKEIKILVGAAGGLFVYATTVIRFVNHLGATGPQKRLRAIIDVISNRCNHDPHTGNSVDTPFAALDAFYTLILQRIPPEISPSVHLLLALLCLWGSLGATLIANILGMSREEFEAVCNHINAVVHFSDLGEHIKLDPTINVDSPYTRLNQGVLRKLNRQVLYRLGGQVSFHHKSFDDFLLDPARSRSYCMKGSIALAKLRIKTHLNYDRSYSWDGSRLILAPGVPDSASSLSNPYTSELVNSLIKARVYIASGSEDLEAFSSLDGFGVFSADCDFRKRLHVSTHLQSGIDVLPQHTSLWGCECHIKVYPGISIRRILLTNFNVDKFKFMVKRREEANVIQRYYPKESPRMKSLFPHKSHEHFESALYRVGRGERSIFWYWQINYKLGLYKDFRAINLVEAEEKFQPEDNILRPE